MKTGKIIINKSSEKEVNIREGLTLILEVMQKYSRQKYTWIQGKIVIFEGAFKKQSTV